VARVQLGFIDDVEPRRPEPDHKLFAKSARNGHLFLSSYFFVLLWCDALANERPY
jgi:hypothetical protein